MTMIMVMIDNYGNYDGDDDDNDNDDADDDGNDLVGGRHTGMTRVAR